MRDVTRSLMSAQLTSRGWGETELRVNFQCLFTALGNQWDGLVSSDPGFVKPHLARRAPGRGLRPGRGIPIKERILQCEEKL